MDVFETSKNLINKKLAMFIAEFLRRANNSRKISFHKISYNISAQVSHQKQNYALYYKSENSESEGGIIVLREII
jgi:hypothetical protein